MKPVSFEYLFDAIHSLPGIGKKHAERIAYFLINKDEQYINDFIRRIKSAHNDIHFCQQCNNITSNELCEICTNDSRNTNLLCIVSSCEDLEKIENTNSYLGYYYVLNGEIDIKTKTVFNEKQIQKILNFISLKKFNEIIFATDWTINGEGTASYLKQIISNKFNNIKFYRIAVGLPINSALNYADDLTIKSALKNKTNY